MSHQSSIVESTAARGWLTGGWCNTEHYIWKNVNYKRFSRSKILKMKTMFSKYVFVYYENKTIFWKFGFFINNKVFWRNYFALFLTFPTFGCVIFAGTSQDCFFSPFKDQNYWFWFHLECCTPYVSTFLVYEYKAP